MAAYARVVRVLGYDSGRAEFSQYFGFSRDLITKRRGDRYEVDALFYDGSGAPYLHVEVKAAPGVLADMPRDVAKEVEYVLDLKPTYLWPVGPGTVDPEAHVWRVEADGLRARFERQHTLPPPPI